MAYREDPTAEYILDRLSDVEKYPEETLVPYEEFSIVDKTYYFTPGGFLYRKAPEPKRWEDFSAATSTTRLGATGPTPPNTKANYSAISRAGLL